MNILFRVDSASKIGLGHFMRCLALAEQYKQDSIIFATQNLSGNANYKIKEHDYQHITLRDTTTQTLVNIIIDSAIDLLIFDHYDIDYEFEKSIKNKTGVKILSFDDTYQPHYCDILLNHNIYAKDEQYKDLVPSFCELRCGEKYTLIRNDFKKIKSKNRQINKNNPTVFVAMGGADSANMNLKVLKVLIKFSDINVNIPTTSTNLNINSLLEFSQKYPQIHIHIDHPNIAQLMDSSDFAIVPTSATVYEVMYLNLPFIAIKTADNQKYVYQYLQEKTYYNSISIDKTSALHKAILDMGMVVKKNENINHRR